MAQWGRSERGLNLHPWQESNPVSPDVQPTAKYLYTLISHNHTYSNGNIDMKLQVHTAVIIKFADLRTPGRP